MKLRKDKLIQAIDEILKKHEEAREVFDEATVVWQGERLADWHITEQPKWVKLRDLITARVKAHKPITETDVVKIFGRSNSYHGNIKFTPYDTTASPSNSVTLRNGKTFKQPGYVDTGQLLAMKRLLDAVEDDYVTDNQLARLGMKNVTPVFRAAVEIGGLVK